jgi:hypothetical protein
VRKEAYSENASSSKPSLAHMWETMMTAILITEVVNGEPYQYYPMGEYVVRAVGVAVDARPSSIPALRLLVRSTA